MGCVGAVVIPALFTGGCRATYYTNGRLELDGVSIAKSEFSYLKNKKPAFREYIIVRNEALEFPVYLYRFSDNDYSAVWMKCSHQGNELQASGDHLTCPAHGSEFNIRGVVQHGPAENPLRVFKVTSDDNQILIDLKA